MRLRLMDFIICPSCRGVFTLVGGASERREYAPEWKERLQAVLTRRNEDGELDAIWDRYCWEVLSGELKCSACQTSYPIEGGVPRILPPALRTVAGGMGRGNPAQDERVKMMDQIAPVKNDEDADLFQRIQLANQSNYGYEWKAFSHQYREWESVYDEYYVTEPPEFFRGKRGLDAGCGMARYSLVPVSRGAEMIGLDLSNAIEAAYGKSREIPFFHAVQGDIFNPPFRDEYFDFAQSLGVIHITPDPERALLSIKKRVKTGGKVFIYVYSTFEGENFLKEQGLKIVTFMRRMTIRMPSPILYKFLYGIVPVVLATCYMPSAILAHLPGCRNVSRKFPYSYEQYRRRRLRDIHMNLFDRFGNPVERRYNRQQMDAWMKDAGFQDFILEPCCGWRVAALKAA